MLDDFRGPGNDTHESTQLGRNRSPEDRDNHDCKTAEWQPRRSKTFKPKRVTRQELEESRADLELLESLRPKTRADCVDGIRPCPFFLCKFNLFLDVNPRNGNIKLNFPGRDILQCGNLCAIDPAERERGDMTLETVGSLMNLTRERVRQIEEAGLLKLRDAPTYQPFDPDRDYEPEGKGP